MKVQLPCAKIVLRLDGISFRHSMAFVPALVDLFRPAGDSVARDAALCWRLAGEPVRDVWRSAEGAEFLGLSQRPAMAGFRSGVVGG